jgi:hypothetical protein
LPPARSQSALLVERSTDGFVDEPPGAGVPGVLDGPVLGVPGEVVEGALFPVPDGLLPEGLPEVPLPDVPLPDVPPPDVPPPV